MNAELGNLLNTAVDASLRRPGIDSEAFDDGRGKSLQGTGWEAGPHAREIVDFLVDGLRFGLKHRSTLSMRRGGQRILKIPALSVDSREQSKARFQLGSFQA
jgi:hypothetical protein